MVIFWVKVIFLGNTIKLDYRNITDERNIIATNKIVPTQKLDPARDVCLPKILSYSKHKNFSCNPMGMMSWIRKPVEKSTTPKFNKNICSG